MSEIQFRYGKRAIKNGLEKGENFLNKTHKFFKTELPTPEERIMKRRAEKILGSVGTLIGLLVFFFFLVKLGMGKFGPAHGLLAQYYNIIGLSA